MLAAAVEIRRWLQDDRHTPYVERLNRDRLIGRKLGVASDNEKLLSWWSIIRADHGEAGEIGPGERVASLRLGATALLFVAGVGLGAGIGGVAFGYQGDYPINLFTLLGVLVGLPMLMLVVTIIVLPGRIPGLSAARNALSGMNPGRWAGALLDRFAGVQLFAVFGNPPASGFARWQLLVFSQWFAVGFFAGVLGMAWLLVAFTDLAFGWSTTLEIEAADVASFVSKVADPWSGWLPAAVPDTGLVEASRFYRLEEGSMPSLRVAQLGQWWPFVLMTIIAYGLLPRLGLLAIGGWRLQVATRSLLREDPEVTALLDRHNTPQASFTGEAESAQIGDEAALPAPTPMSKDETTAVIVWNQAASDAVAGAWLRDHFEIQWSGSAAFSVLQSATEQRRLVDEIGEDVRRLVIFTKGWEPPLLEFSDFLKIVRDRLGPEVSFTLVPP